MKETEAQNYGTIIFCQLSIRFYIVFPYCIASSLCSRKKTQTLLHKTIPDSCRRALELVLHLNAIQNTIQELILKLRMTIELYG